MAENRDARKITVRVYNRAGVSPETLSKAMAEAQRIFVREGIEIQWLNCPVIAADEHRVPECLEAWRPTEVALRILPGWSPRYGGKELGYSLPSADGGALANIYYKRIQQLAARQLGSETCILGEGIAHELGHLLLLGISHSSSGIMRAEWTVSDLDAAASGRLLFSSAQATAIRDEVRRRTLVLSAAGERTINLAPESRR